MGRRALSEGGGFLEKGWGKRQRGRALEAACFTAVLNILRQMQLDEVCSLDMGVSPGRDKVLLLSPFLTDVVLALLFWNSLLGIWLSLTVVAR